VQSAPGRGTTFRILWPQAAGPAKPSSSDFAVDIRGGSETILLVEDEDQVRGLAAKVLAGYGYRVIEARDGAEAEQLGRTAADHVHLLVTDVVMPGGMSGLDLSQRLAPLRPKMKVLFMSGYADDAITRRGVLAEEAAFLPKPFTPEVLARRVREVLDGEVVMEPAAITATGGEE